MNKRVLQHFKNNDPKVYTIIKNVDVSVRFGKNKGTTLEYFESLTKSIVSQQLSTKAAASIYKKFLDLFSKNTITPKMVLGIDKEKLRAAGLSYRKIEYLKDLAQKTISGEIDLKNINKTEDYEVINELVKVKGIGVWTAEMFLIFTLNRQNVFSYGDLGVKKGIMKVYNIKTLTEAKANKITKAWEPYKTYGTLAMWESLND